MDFENEAVSLQQLPQFSTVTFTPLHERYARIRLSVLLVFYAVLAIPSALAMGLSVELREFLATIEGMFALALSLALLTFIAWFRYIATKAIHYSIRQHDIILKSGVFWKKEVIQPLKRVQHVELTRGPIDERYGLANVRLFSAGTALSTFVIRGVEHEIAARIKQFVLDYQEKNGEEFTAHRLEVNVETASEVEVESETAASART